MAATVTTGITDKAILAAFEERRREFAANYHLMNMTKEQEDAYFGRIDEHEAVICETPAATIAGILAKLRIDFMHRAGAAWSDHAIIDPTVPAFIDGLAEADRFTQLAWAAVEDLARIGGIHLSKEGR